MAAMATRQAATPTRLWKVATSCGIEVMATRRAISAPMPPPIDHAAQDQADGQRRRACVAQQPQGGDRRRCPCRSCRCGCPPGWSSGEDRPRSARMNSTPGDEVEDSGDIRVHVCPRAGRYFDFFLYIASIRWVTRKPPKMFTAAKAAATAPAPLETRMLAGQPRRTVVPRGRGGQQGADDDHRGDGVGHGHQRRVQGRA